MDMTADNIIGFILGATISGVIFDCRDAAALIVIQAIVAYKLMTQYL